MLTASFYLLDEATEDTQARLACRITHKAYQQGLSIYLQCDTREKAESLDSLLWTFQDISFIPHRLVTDPDEARIVVVIGWNACKPPACEVLINLTEHIPDFFKNFHRIIEIVTPDTAAKAIARQKYQTYRETEYTLKTHDLTKHLSAQHP